MFRQKLSIFLFILFLAFAFVNVRPLAVLGAENTGLDSGSEALMASPDFTEIVPETTAEAPAGDENGAETSVKVPSGDENGAETSVKVPSGAENGAETSVEVPSIAENGADPSAEAPAGDGVDAEENAEGENDPPLPEYELSRAEISNEVLSYTGHERTKASILVYGNVTENDAASEVMLSEGTDYSIEYTNNINAGTAVITIRGTGNYQDKTLTETFAIEPAEISTLKLSADTFVYTGALIKPEIKVYAGTDGERILLKRGSDYDFCYTDNLDVGTAEITVTGKRNFQGTMTRTFVISPAAITSVRLKYATLAYNGTARKQNGSTLVKCGNKTLKYGSDYTISYKNNRKIGTAVMTIRGKGNYTGTITKTFAIKGRLTEAVLKYSSLKYTGKPRRQSGSLLVKGNHNGKIITLKKGVDYKIAYTNNTNVGTAAMKITGKGNYTGTITKKYRIRAVSLRNVVLSTASRMYTGKAQEPSPAVTARVDGKVVTLVKGTDYTVSYKNNTAPGIATVTVTGIGNFQGTVEKTFEIVRVKIAGSGANRTVTFASGNAAYDALRAAVWTEQNGQDDLTWYAMQKKKSGIWILKIDLVNFKTYGPANVHIYAGDALVYKVSLSIDHQDWLTTQSNRFKSEFLFGTNPYANIDYIQCAINVANNNYYGYGHTWRINRHTISCAGFVGLCLTYCGYGDLIKDDPPEIIDGVRWGYLDLGKYSGKYDWKDIMVNEIGATWHPGLDGIQPGDVLYYDYSLTVNHTGFYLGNGYSVESRAPYTQPSLNDDDGAEIAVYSDTFSRYKWQGYFRIPNKKKAW